jgi:cyclic pyranopterin phosphate synthase
MSIMANDKMRLIITGKCNLDCFYCHNEGQAKQDTFMRVQSVQLIAGAINIASSRASEVTISGGEPFLHQQLVDIVALAATFSNNVTMVSNGVLASPSRLKSLANAGLTKLRLGVDSLASDKPRPSPGRLKDPFILSDIVKTARDYGLAVDMNVVMTRFNRSELGRLAEYAVRHGLSIKFFEHVTVDEFGTSDRAGTMLPSPHVTLDALATQIREALGRSIEFSRTADFGEANLHCFVNGVEIRYCRYLCPYGLCWVTGTRVDAEGYVYNCMVNRGIDRLTDVSPASIVHALEVASARPCQARLPVDS